MKNLNDVFNSVDEAINNVRKNPGFEDMLNKTKQYARKSAEAIEISRKKIELLDAKTKLSKAYEKFGKQQFAIYDGEEANEQELEATANEIIILKGQVEYLDQEIATFKEELASQFETKMGKKDEDVVVGDDNIEVVEVDGE
ncbi:MAG: hypothetical protein PUE46_03290 [Eubacteriales bacterium]|nr:hypothetical protein [Eubacteriales bacterium]